MAKETESTLKLSKVFGYQQAVKGSLGFSRTYGLTSITGKKGIHYKLGTNQQAFTSIPEENKITAVGFGADDLLIIASKGKRGTIAVFNFRNNEKKILPVAEKIIRENAMTNALWVSVRNNISKRWNTTENDVSKNQSSADSVIRLPNTSILNSNAADITEHFFAVPNYIILNIL
ncbi:cilia-and flagella-associated protein 57 [Trichonephila clavipes]|nr:cilia-and flagella-associated protein 57 [Trichonephila clavipes]